MWEERDFCCMSREDAETHPRCNPCKLPSIQRRARSTDSLGPNSSCSRRFVADREMVGSIWRGFALELSAHRRACLGANRRIVSGKGIFVDVE